MIALHSGCSSSSSVRSWRWRATRHSYSSPRSKPVSDFLSRKQWAAVTTTSGATSVPPAAPIDTYVARIDGLKKAAASAHAPPNNKRIAKLKREIETLQRQNQQLLKAGIEGQKYVDYWRLANPLFDNPIDSVMFLRKAMVFVHPDKQPDHKASANALQQILNHLVHELRTA